MKSKLLRFALTVVSFVALSIGIASAQQTITVNGTVKDTKGEPVLGAALMVKGTLNGTVTDEFGSFSIEVKSNATLEVSSIGYETLEVPVAGKTQLDIVLKDDTTELEATVVVAYGEVRAKDFTGAVQQVNVSKSPQAMMGFTNPGEFLRGNVPGMQMGQPTGVGSAPSMMVRGKKSLGSTSSEPLLVVDGMIYKGDMTNIDPSNIESMSVLKDASSLAAYGSQAAQGVIMITTKKGLSGKPTIDFSTTQSWNSPTVKPKYYQGEEYVKLRNARLGNYDDLTNTGVLTDIERENLAAGNSTDWYDLSTQNGYTQNYNVRVSGGTESINYSISFGHSNQNGIQVGNNFKRTNISARVNANINKYMTAGLTMDYSATGSTGGTSSMYYVNTSPLGSPYFKNSGLMRKAPTGGDVSSSINPLWDTDEANGYEHEMDGMRQTYTGNFEVKAPWVKGLSYKLNASYGRNTMHDYTFYHEQYYPTDLATSSEDNYTAYDLSQAYGSRVYNNNTNWVIDNIITYATSLGKHGINASLVYTRDSEMSEGQTISGSNFQEFGNTLLGWYGLNQATTRTINAGTYTLHNDVGYLARAMYSYDARYAVNLSFRRDGSSVFGADKKWGNFPAVGLAWTVSNEKFMKNVTKIDDLKLKLSWGINGSQTLSPYGTLSTVTLGKSSTGLQTVTNGTTTQLYSQYVSAIGNPDLGWQQTESINGGFEVTAFNRKVNADVNGYWSKTTDQIFSRTIPIMGSGVSSQLATMGQINNWGIEAVVNTTNIQKKDFNWTSQFTFNLNRNKLVHLWGGEDEADDITNGYFIGQSLDVIWWYKSDGVIQEDYTGSIPSRLAGYGNVIDQNGDGTLDNDDKVFQGNTKENFRITMSNTFSYKNWQLYFTLNGTFGGNGYCLADNTYAYFTHDGFAYKNSRAVGYWTPTNHSNKYLAASCQEGSSTWKVFNSWANVRLQNVNLSYNITPLVKNFGIKSARLSVSGQNLFYIAPKWKYNDPDGHSSTVGSSFDSIRTGNANIMRTFTVGLNISL